MLTPHELATLDADGCVTIDTPFDRRRLLAAATAVARLLPRAADEPRASRSNDFLDPEILELVQDPFVEQAMIAALRSQAVEFFENAIVRVFPCPGQPFGFWEHIDVKCRTDAFDSVPKRTGAAFIVWLSDVDPDNAPMMVRPGSHRLLGDWWMRNQPASIEGLPFAHLPELPYAQAQPVLARMGQATICFTSAVHGGSIAIRERDRRSLHLGFIPAGLAFDWGDAVARQRYLDRARASLRPERAHLIPQREVPQPA